MKNATFLIITFLIFTIFSCNVENVENNESLKGIETLEKKKEPKDFIVSDTENGVLEDTDEHCKTVNLIAGQNHIAGTVTVDVDGDNLIITYTTNDDWELDATHLSITNCEEGSFPSTNSGNPKIGKFEYSSLHDTGVNQVIYTIPVDDVTETFCFAAHAEVSGETGETAWAEGSDFGGNSWAMFVEATLTECDTDDDDDIPA